LAVSGGGEMAWHANPAMIMKVAVLALSTALPSYVLATSPQVLPVRMLGPDSVEGHGQRSSKQPPLASSDSMQLLTQLYSTVNLTLAFGDTDHDGFNEVIMAVTFGDFTYRILEEQGNNAYVEEFVGPYVNPYASGDFDGDGNSEVLGQYGDRLFVYESPSPSTHPSLISWQSPPLTNVLGYATVADTDGDGRIEIIHSVNTFGIARLVIYENTGDNTFCQVHYSLGSPQDDGPKLVADLDGDGRKEIALCGTYGYIHVYESLGDDLWAQTFFDSTGLDNAYAVAGGVDTDGNGRPELFVTGDSQEVPGERQTFVYEAVCNDHFTRVAILPFYDAHRGGLRSCVADLDATGREEFIYAVFSQLLVYRSCAPRQWAIVLTVPDPDSDGTHTLALPFDVNRNGRPELFWVESGHAAFGNTLVLEHTTVPHTGVSNPQSAEARFTVFPNPCRAVATLLLPSDPRSAASTIATFDASGRLVARSKVEGGDNRLLWSVTPLRPGIYFLRLESSAGAALAQGRVTVIR
jgi:VCBS repeat protein